MIKYKYNSLHGSVFVFGFSLNLLLEVKLITIS